MSKIWKYIFQLRRALKEQKQVTEYYINERERLNRLLERHCICPDCGESFENCEMYEEVINEEKILANRRF